MAVVTPKSTAITNLDALPQKRASSWNHGGDGKHYAALIAGTNGDSIGSVYRFFRISSNMRAHALALFCDALTSGAGDIGLYRTAADGGAVVDQDFFASAVAMGTALNGTDVTYESGNAASNMGLSQAEKRIWEVMGLAADPGLEYDVAITLTTALGGSGNIVLRGSFVW
jgi:hypothetical protein